MEHVFWLAIFCAMYDYALHGAHVFNAECTSIYPIKISMFDVWKYKSIFFCCCCCKNGYFVGEKQRVEYRLFLSLHLLLFSYRFCTDDRESHEFVTTFTGDILKLGWKQHRTPLYISPPSLYARICNQSEFFALFRSQNLDWVFFSFSLTFRFVYFICFRKIFRFPFDNNYWHILLYKQR